MKKTHTLSKLFIALCCLWAFPSAAEDIQKTTGKWEFSGNLSIIALDGDAAVEQRIEDDAWGIGFTADYDNGRFLTSIGLDLVNYGDDASFTQRTEDTFGNERNSESDASGVLASIAFGPLWKLGKDQSVTTFIQGGFGHMFSSSRSISNCSNCFSEDIDIEGGPFAKFGVLKNTGSIAIGVSYYQYLGGDGLQNSLNFVLSTPY